MLKTYERVAGNDQRYFLKNKNEVSLFGLKLIVESLPYQMQDSIVSACATTSIWISLHALNKKFDVNLQSPFEITNTSIMFPGTERNFPSTGLTTFQMKNYFNSIGIETEVINVKSKPTSLSPAIKSYLNYNLPIIAFLKLEDRSGLFRRLKRLNYHAVVISGYRTNIDNEIVELYIHDDGIGPYSRVVSRNGDLKFTSWENEWISKEQYTDISVEKLIVPIYPKIRLSFNKLYEFFVDFKQHMLKNNHDVELFITDVKLYKESILEKNISNKLNILSCSCPKYFWVFRVKRDGKILKDILMDATTLLTSTNPLEVNYE